MAPSRLHWLLGVGIIAAFLLGCGGGGGADEDEIKKTIEDFVLALSEDPPTAYTLLAEDCKQEIEYLEFAAQLTFVSGFVGKGDVVIKDFEVTDEGKDDVTADFEVAITSGGEEIPLGVLFEETTPARFVKEDGRWRFAECAGFSPAQEIVEGTTETEITTPEDSSLSAAQAAEADSNAEFPGEWVDLAALYGGPYPDTASHVQRQVDYRSQGLPPVGGDHWGDAGACPSDPAQAPLYCGPVPAGFYPDPDNTWEAESVVHNLEHAGIVVWYNTDDQRIIDELRDFATDHGLGRSGANVTLFYPEMEEDTVAITTWSRRLVMTVDEFDREKLEKFYDAHECRFDPEGFC